MPLRPVLVWGAMAAAILVPLAIAAASPLLAYRDAVYIVASFAGIAALGLLLLQPLLAAGLMPGLGVMQERRVHRWAGTALVGLVAVHVGALWITSPPDVVDALTFASPTQFSLWGVIGMWAVFATALLASMRRKLRPRRWRAAHVMLAVVIVGGTVAHAMLIEGAMGTLSKAMLCALVVAATAALVWKRRFR